MALSRDALLRLARSGAAARVQELQAELEAIYRTFPDLRRGVPASRVAAAKATPAAAKPERSRKAWSAADRKAVSERMKKYWAARKARTAKKA